MSLVLLATIWSAPVRAEAELFPSTEVTASYDVWGWVKGVWQDKMAKPAATEVALAEDFSGIEPASGGGEAKAEAGHGEPAAHGKTEGQKSHTGKVLTAAPKLPTVMIGGKAIVTKAELNAKEVADTTPAGLKTGSLKDLLERRYYVTPYAHSPQRGDPAAKVKIIEFVDLSCGQCMPELAKIDAALQTTSSSVLVTHIHAPTTRFQDTNMPAFYGKIADKAGKFWVYRANLIQDKPVDANAIFDELVKSGMGIAEARSSMLNDARRFYRELDADSLLARSFGIGKPPVLFVNGIRVGESGIPLDKLQDVLEYVNARLERGLPEPPK